MSSIISTAEDDIKAKWESLRLRFVRERKALISNPPSGTGADDAPPLKSKWTFYDSMSFMNRHVKQRM